MSKQMKAGKELDLLIAEKVLHLPPRLHEFHWEDIANVGSVFHCVHCGAMESDLTTLCALPYSIDIAEAWRIVEILLPNREFHISPRSDNTMVVCNSEPFDAAKQFVVVADTAPLAICIAALKAVEAESK